MTRLVAVDVDLQQRVLDGCLAGWVSEKLFKVSQERSGREGVVEGDGQRGVVEVMMAAPAPVTPWLCFPVQGSARRRRSCQGVELQIRGGLWGKMAGYARAAGAKNGKESKSPSLADTVESQPAGNGGFCLCTGQAGQSFNRVSQLHNSKSVRTPKESPQASNWQPLSGS